MILSVDTETTTYNKGNPFDSRNRLVCWSYAYTSVHASTTTDASGAYRDEYGVLQSLIDKASLIIGFNIKFDLHWLTKIGIVYNYRKVWDVQLAEFILSNQTHRFPSLDEVAEKYGLPKKYDKVKEYWDRGVQTDEIPWEVLEEYATYDAELPLKIYPLQKAKMTPEQVTLCHLQCQDLSILREMECNGLAFDEQLCQTRAEELDKRIEQIKTELSKIYPDVPINFNSNDHLSAFLYGGTVKEDGKEFIGFYKSGDKKGQPKHKNIIIEHKLPRLYTPLKGSEMAKEGNYAVDEGTLRKLRGKRHVLDLILELSKLEKLNGTYYRGLTKLRQEMNWPVGYLHGNFNQTTAATGRLSSSRPNLQNFASDLQDIFVSRYND